MLRLFIAVDVSVSVVERLTILQQAVASRLGDANVRWVAAPDIHVTLKYLGDVHEATIPMLDDALTRLAKPLFPFEVRCCRVGAYPDLDAPLLIWAGLDDTGAEVMGLLRQTIERDLVEMGFAQDDREYKPHLTLGRLRGRNHNAKQHIEEFVNLDFGSSFVKDIVLFESRLTERGPEYLVRRRFALGEV